MRTLTFGDDKDNEETWAPGEPEPGADPFRDPGYEAFRAFVNRHLAEDNQSFYLEDEAAEEALIFLFDSRTICRARTGAEGLTEYRLVTNEGDYRTLATNFVRAGFAALDRHGPWLPDVGELSRARLRFEFDRSVLRRTHPRELRRRLDILSRIDVGAPEPVDGVTHYGFGNGGGDTVNAWFRADGRGLVLTFDHTGDLNFYEDARAQAALYDGVPADLLELVRDIPETDTTLNVALPGGGTLVAASGVFHFSGPCAMSEGLLATLQEKQLGIDDTGVGWLLENFLSAEFTPESVADTVSWWDTGDIADAFASAPPPAAEAPAEPEAVERFCRIWADSGYNDPAGIHYVLFDGESREDAGEAYERLLGLIDTLGLERVDAPPGSADGEVWVRTDPRIDAELGNWA